MECLHSTVCVLKKEGTRWTRPRNFDERERKGRARWGGLFKEHEEESKGTEPGCGKRPRDGEKEEATPDGGGRNVEVAGGKGRGVS